MAIVIIPARLNSSRLPEKVILDLEGKPVIQHVYDQIRNCQEVDQVLIATDDQKVVKVVSRFTDRIVMTSPFHVSGTDRIAEVAGTLDASDATLIINVQGDEPFIEPAAVDTLIRNMRQKHWQIGTLIHSITHPEQLNNPNIVKCVRGEQGRALYFSRLPVPFLRDIPVDQWVNVGVHFRHIGVYGFQRKTLLDLAKLPPVDLENQEKLEQLRWLSHGYAIYTVESGYEPLGIDTLEDLQAAQSILHDRKTSPLK